MVAGTPAEEQQAALVDWLDFAEGQRHNAVFFQVRPTADSFWPGAREPWSRYLTGTQGVDPGYDPLGLAVAEAHKRNLELHVWFNPFRVPRGVVAPGRQRGGQRRGAAAPTVARSSRMTISFEVGVFDPRAVESSGTSTLVSGK